MRSRGTVIEELDAMWSRGIVSAIGIDDLRAYVLTVRDEALDEVEKLIADEPEPVGPMPETMIVEGQFGEIREVPVPRDVELHARAAMRATKASILKKFRKLRGGGA